MRITPLIRPMKESDVDIVARLRCDAFFEGTDRTVTEDAEGLRQLMLDGRFEIAFVAELNGIPIGSCLFIRSELEAAHDVTPWLAGLVVAPDHRGRGIGQELVRAVESVWPNSTFTHGRRRRFTMRWAGRRLIHSCRMASR